MKKYISLIKTFASLAGCTISHLKPGDTDLVNLDEGSELLVIFPPRGSDDIFLIFEEDKAVITFGQWAQELQGSSLENFELLIDLIRGIMEEEYVVREIRTDRAEAAVLTCESNNQAVSVYSQEGREYLSQCTALEFFENLAGRPVFFEKSIWNSDFEEPEEEDWNKKDEKNNEKEYRYSSDRFEREKEELQEDSHSKSECSCCHH